MRCFLGFDGGGTKTDCVAVNEAGSIVARGQGPASNPTRIGFPSATAALRLAADSALNATRIPLEIAALCAGLAGTGLEENRSFMERFFREQFPDALVDVRMDLELPLCAMPQGAAIILVAGTGSAAIGRNAAGIIKREGGFGPATSDEGSAFDIGRMAIDMSRAEDSSTPHKDARQKLSRQILQHLGRSNWAEVDSVSTENPDDIFPRVFPVVAAAADAGNAGAQSVLKSAAEKLAAIVVRLAEALDLHQQTFPLGKTGGTVGRSRYFDKTVDEALHRKLPGIVISKLSIEPAEVAAWIALQLFNRREGDGKREHGAQHEGYVP
jgi:glucosamine kinase